MQNYLQIVKAIVHKVVLLKENHTFFKTLEDRNKLSHIYKEEMVNDVFKNLALHLSAFQNLILILKNT